MVFRPVETSKTPGQITVTNKPRFPRNPQDRQQFLDKYGNKWEFKAETKSWISKGVVQPLPTVTEQADGLITPEIFRKLINLRALGPQITSSNTLKIAPGNNANWYYFRSSDKSHRFKAESQNELRIEIDIGRLYRQFLLGQSVGLTGDPGVQGPPGQDGVSGIDPCGFQGEPDYQPDTRQPERLDFAIFTPTPLQLDGPIPLPGDNIPDISIRVFKIQDDTNSQTAPQLQFIDRLLGPRQYKIAKQIAINQSLGIKTQTSISPIYIRPPKIQPISQITIELDAQTGQIKRQQIGDIPVDPNRTIITFDPETSLITGSLFLEEGQWGPGWTVRSRQKGPDGETGPDGEPTLRIFHNTVDTDNIQAICPLVNARLDRDKNTIHTTCSEITSEGCVSKIKLLPGANLLTPPRLFDTKFPAAQMTLQECKNIHTYQPSIPQYDLPQLDLPHWDPQPGCVTQRSFDRHKFDWIERTDIGICDPIATWFGPEGAREAKYPYPLLLPKRPAPDECCQETFFYCDAIQDAPCPGEPPPPPSPSPVASQSVPNSPQSFRVNNQDWTSE